MEKSVFWVAKFQVHFPPLSLYFTYHSIELERDLELERRKIRDMQETSRERDKEYQKLKVHTLHVSSNKLPAQRQHI
jgi:lipase chaperone LimK